MALVITVTTTAANFKEAFCRRFGCTEEAFLEELFWRALAPRWRWLVSLLRRVNRGAFRADFEYLERIGAATSWRDVASLANGIRRDPGVNRGFWRRSLQLRISGEHLLKLRAEILYPRPD